MEHLAPKREKKHSLFSKGKGVWRLLDVKGEKKPPFKKKRETRAQAPMKERRRSVFLGGLQLLRMGLPTKKKEKPGVWGRSPLSWGEQRGI